MTDFENKILEHCNRLLNLRCFHNWGGGDPMEYKDRWVRTYSLRDSLKKETGDVYSYQRIRKACDKMVAGGILDKNPARYGYASYSPKSMDGTITLKNYFSRDSKKKTA